MATLTDCFAFAEAPSSVDSVLAHVTGRLSPVTSHETVTLQLAVNRIAASDVVARRAVPPHDNSAVDGFLVRHADLNIDQPTDLPVAGRIAAGHPLKGEMPSRSAVRILTGAPICRGVGDDPDTVLMQEECEDLGERVILPANTKRGANYRQAGEDVPIGATVVSAGSRLRPAEIGVLASLGISNLTVRRPLRVALFSTGDELKEPGGAAPAGAIYDANRYSLAAMITALGMEAVDFGIIQDNPDAIRHALEKATDQADVIVSSGGMAMGEEDHVKPALRSLGGRLDFWRLALKPGRPMAIGEIGGKSFLGLPGNPVAVSVAFLIVARPILLTLAGASGRSVSPVWIPVQVAFSHHKKPGRAEYLRVRIEIDSDGRSRAHRFERDGSGILTSLVWADGLLRLDEADERIVPGQFAAYCPLTALL
jgi:molybdopterin molybdotransferase